ncbi:MAG: DNA-binding protein WhiA [Bacillota bacterium]|nr:DNA-binding protein WhiA [Bacillota bacterium]
MTFSVSTKDELSRVFGRPCCVLAEISALARVGGRLGMAGSQPASLVIVSENAAVARKAYRLAKDLGLPARTAVSRNARLRKGYRYEVRLPLEPDPQGAMRKLGLEQRGIKKSLVRRNCCRRAYLRGAFLARGSVASPRGPYHLEIMVEDEVLARDLAALMERLSLEARVSPRRQGWTIYIKEGTQIVDCLNLMGAHAALLSFEDARILKEMRNRVNRLVNCDTANLNKAVDAGVRQQECIRVIAEGMGLEKLPPALRELALLRQRHPDVSLRELGELADPPLSKSCINHRMRRLETVAAQLRARGEARRGAR